jgi:hypothetical protein
MAALSPAPRLAPYDLGKNFFTRMNADSGMMHADRIIGFV